MDSESLKRGFKRTFLDLFSEVCMLYRCQLSTSKLVSKLFIELSHSSYTTNMWLTHCHFHIPIDRCLFTRANPPGKPVAVSASQWDQTRPISSSLSFLRHVWDVAILSEQLVGNLSQVRNVWYYVCICFSAFADSVSTYLGLSSAKTCSFTYGSSGAWIFGQIGRHLKIFQSKYDLWRHCWQIVRSTQGHAIPVPQLHFGPYKYRLRGGSFLPYPSEYAWRRYRIRQIVCPCCNRPCKATKPHTGVWAL